MRDRSPISISFLQNILACLLLITFFFLSIRPIRAADIWWHLATGRYLWQAHRYPTVDIFSSTATGQPWQNYEWLFQVFLYGAYQVLGLGAIVLYKTLAVSGILLAVWWRLKNEQIPIALRAACIVLIYWACRATWTERADLISIFGVSLIALGTLGRKRPPLFIWPLGFGLWANMHGGFVLGLALLAIRTAFSFDDKKLNRYWISATLLSCAATLFNPLGWRLYALIWDGIRSLNDGLILEWARTPWQHMQLFWILLTGIWIILARSWTSRRIQNLTEITYALLLTWAAVSHVRNTPFAIVVLLPMALITSYEDATFRSFLNMGTGKKAFLFYMSTILCTATASVYAAAHMSWGASRSTFPEAACNYIETHYSHETFYNDYAFGGYWIWRFAGKFPVFIDGRLHTVKGYLPLYRDIQRAQGGSPAEWQAFLDRHHVSAAIIRYVAADDQAGIYNHYFQPTLWTPVYRDPVAIVFLKRKS